jgi:hypothetical protein
MPLLKKSFAPHVAWLAFAGAACSSTTDRAPTPATSTQTQTFVEKALTIELALGVANEPADAGADDTDDATPASTLEITARDGTTPVITDLWLYTLDGDQMTPLTGFTSTAARKSPHLMLPATVSGVETGLVPADDGSANGLMTNTTRGTWEQGAFASTVNGTVLVTLPAAPTAPIVVVAAVEDQRYAGAATINPDGTPGTTPPGIGVPETHVRRSFEREVVPLLADNCASCHRHGGPDDADFYLVTGSAADLVSDNFALKENTEDCAAANPAGSAELAACIQAITKAEFLVEPGAPAVSDLLTRSRPDENAGTSDTGLAWYGGGNPKSRFNATYGDRRMPSTTQSTDPNDWVDMPTYFDLHPEDYQVLFDWVAQGAEATP